VFSFTSDVINIYILGDRMQKKGWLLDRLQFPPCLHIIINPYHAKIIEQFFNDLKNSVEEVKSNPTASANGTAAMYGMTAQSSDRKTIKETVIRYLQDQYDL